MIVKTGGRFLIFKLLGNVIEYHRDVQWYARTHPSLVLLLESTRMAEAARQATTSQEWKMLKRRQRILEQAAAQSTVVWSVNDDSD